jgi:small GTP-binding protein
MQKDEIIKHIEESARTGQTKLDLSRNKLSELPAEIMQLVNLTTLNLSWNQLSELPAEITQLVNLTTLDLLGNELSELPAEITQLANLTALYLSGNQLSELPAEIAQLVNLTTLYLSMNQLSELPAEITQLANLTALDLSGNKLSELPAEIIQLANLTTLDLSGNKLSELPAEITQLANLTRLDLQENPLKSPPPEIAGQGVEAIFEYLRQLLEKETEATLVNEAKLIMVGQGEVGKTCLAKRLIYDEFIEDKTTEGIDIFKWAITAPTNEKEEIKLNVWDFGGQEIYHATHQFFLTKRSVYLLVWNARKSRDYEHIYYWLHTIEAFGEDSPIILVLSKFNERNDDLNMTDLREKFPQIIDLYKVDSEDGKGIPVLKDIISDTAWQMPHMQTPWVGSWFRVRELLEQNENNWIRYSDFCQICQSEELDEKQTDILDEYLHDLGVIIHFRDIRVQDMVILKPEWATKAFYKILDMDAVKEREGILLHSELGQIWDTHIYPKDIHPKLLELMNKFELVSELPDKRSHLVAELLPSTQPEFEWDTTDNLCFYYQYEFLPAGVMTRFIVRIHQNLEKRSDSKQLCWREGVVLCREGTRAFVRVRPLEKLIEIRIDGSNKKELLTIIRYHFDEINKSIKKVKITKEIPCSCSTDCSYKFNYKGLLDAEKEGIKKVQCQKNWKDVSLSLLLDGYERKEDRMKDMEKRTVNESRIIVEVNPHIEVKPEIKPKIEVKSRVNVETNVDINLKVDLPSIQSEFEDFKDLLIEFDPKFERKLNEIGDNLDEVSAESDKEKFIKPFNKLGRFLQKLGDENSDYCKIISGSKKGIELAQKLGKTYNKFAQWIPTLPVVPDLFLGK